MRIEAMGYVGTVAVEDEENVFVGRITRKRDNQEVWVDGCDREDYVRTWIIGTFDELNANGKAETCEYGEHKEFADFFEAE